MEPPDSEELRKDFTKEAIIHVPDTVDEWHTVSGCVWSSPTPITGKARLSHIYPNHAEFFMHFLGVPVLMLDMLYKDLMVKGSSGNSNAAEMKQTLLHFSALLAKKKDHALDPRLILDSNVFPVRIPGGQTQLCSASADFAIVDRKAFGTAFQDKAQLLDFTFEKTHELRSFFEWVDMGNRRLSVRE
ncbi:hypothetical protein PG994_003247 [Apiospora phragmitis]|uniref:Uncharacterized protein n=1 Tax=Apiospora phragmitis TaxID=2905665 RepID=A0ABR1VXI8_9PEZI